MNDLSVPRTASPPAPDARQSLRMRRMLMAAASSMLMPLVIAAYAALGVADYAVAGWAALLIGAISVGFFLFFKAGLNLGFRDPSMSAQLTLSAILTVAAVSYWAGGAQRSLAIFYVMALFFGALRLRAGPLLWLAAVALAAHGTMLWLWHANHPRSDPTVPIVDFAVLTLLLPWFAAMGGYVNGLRARLSESNRKLSEALARIEDIAVHDELTGLYNRRFLLEVLARETASLQRTGRPFAVCLLDIDHFKSVNDAFGHVAGDEVLKHFSVVAGTGKRGADVFGRLGGEEFLLVMPDTGLPGALACAERMRVAVEGSAFPMVSADRAITVTSGVALAKNDESVTALLARADDALYKGKAEGRNRVVCAA